MKALDEEAAGIIRKDQEDIMKNTVAVFEEFQRSTGFTMKKPKHGFSVVDIIAVIYTEQPWTSESASKLIGRR